MKKNIELLAPAGDFECIKAAVQNGADSVYFGGSLFNARASASNFDSNGLKDAIDYCTIRNVKTHLTLNTLIKDDEFEDATNLALEAYQLGIDAIIVQDLGLAKYLIKNFPDLPIHASTQMSIHNLEGVKEAEKLGFKRVVLSRELSLSEIEYICANSNIEIETFVHGALCICYSGQCLFSSIVGGRSGNRGRCAQPCRLPYSLISKNDKEEVLDKGYLLSPKDLCALEYLPNLINAGVDCFKIEGRLKSPEYVATVTRIYRKYIDMVLNNENYVVDEKDKKDLMQVFNRGGFSTGHLDNNPNKNLIFKEKPSNIGIYVGTVSNYNKNKGHIKLKLEDNLSIGDTINFEKEPYRYTVSELMIGNNNFTDLHYGDKVTIGRMKGNISVGDKIYKMASKKLSNTARISYENCENRKVLVNCIVTVKRNNPISMKIICTNNRHNSDNYHNIKVEVISDTIPVDAITTPITTERIIKQISKTNNTPFTFENITVNLDDGLYIPSISCLNELRRSALEVLEAQVISKKSRNLDISHRQDTHIKNIELLEKKHPKVALSLRFLSNDFDYTKLDSSKIDKIYLALKLFLNKDYENIINYLSENYNLYIYMPTIIKSNYRNMILNSLENILKKFNIKGFIISNIADFKILEKYHKNYDFVGNYSLNVFNSYSLNEYKKLGLNRLTLSRELNKEGLHELLLNSDIDGELIVYGNLPIMAINYCLLGKTNKCYPNCQMQCRKTDNTYYLKDRLGYKFRIIPDSLQTVTLICNSKTLSLSSKEIPINCVRVDILDENIEKINEIVDIAYNREKFKGNDYTNGNFNKEI